MSATIASNQSTAPGSLAFDILSAIFKLTVGSLWLRDSCCPFVAGPLQLAHVNQHWRHVAMDSALLWNSIDITKMSNLDMVAYALARSRNAPLHLDIDFYKLGIHRIRDIMALLSVHLPRAETLAIRVGSSSNADVLAPMFRRACLGALRSLTLACGPRQMSPYDAALFEVTCGMASMESLRIDRVSFSLELACLFRRLRVLVIRNVVPSCAPTVSDWEEIERSAPNLERVALQNVGCRGVVGDARRPLTFPALTHLELVFAGGSVGLFSLVSSLDAPSLRYLSITASSTNVLECILNQSRTGTSLRHMVLDFEEIERIHLHAIFSRTPHLTSLDIRAWDSDILDLLNRVESAQPGALPHCTALAVLFVTDGDPDDVREFMESRSTLLPDFAFEHVLFRNKMVSGEFDEDLDWIHERTSVGVGIGHDEMGWLQTDFYIGLEDYTLS
ncbi:hypothetical protein C8F04DRAFT_1280986 [Mycena alexandri]|uniref:F-box domain-containing protein n=1 Tax=Mycena alexandri TaxID=1745969 RepID=A0AAD6WPX4_9AGAR|nr:hypothetical protein C8F04DRAFT_1280986 [Mycena alexandri]